VLAGLIGTRLPSSFLPDEDQGYVFVALQLPDASSLQRTSLTARTGGRHSDENSRRRSCDQRCRYNMISGVQNTFSSFFWVTLKEWGERKTPEETYDAIQRSHQRRTASTPRGRFDCFFSSGNPGLGTSGASPLFWRTAVVMMFGSWLTIPMRSWKPPVNARSWRRCLLPCWRLSPQVYVTLSEIKSWPKVSI